MGEKLTPQQKMAVENRGGKLLVSAAAGSGKTKVLVDRLLCYLLDSVAPAELDQFLIITYTKAAASELRGKIAEKLSEKIAEDPANQHLQRQMQKLYMTKISTVHGFCTDILREYAYKLGVAGDFRVADENECTQLQMSVLEAMLEDIYKPEGVGNNVRVFLETQGISRNDNLIPQLITDVYKSSRCHLDPDRWLKKCAEPVGAEDLEDPSETPWGAYLIRCLQETVSLHIAALRRCMDAACRADGFEKVTERLSLDISALQNLRTCHSWEEIFLNKDVDYGRFPTVKDPSDPILLERIKAVRDNAKKRIGKKLEAFSDPAYQVLLDLKSTGAAAQGLVELVFSFSGAYDKLKKARRVMDFSDLEQRVLDLLLGKSRTSPTAAAREISGRFREVMVDEYQDSNAVQDAIFSALTDQRHNCFMVGDVKQSIYQFRLADPTIFLEKYNTYKYAEKAQPQEGRKILLSRNFRSGGGVLSAANDVFFRCMSERVGGLVYTDEEKLIEGIEHIDIGQPETELYAIEVQEDTYQEEAQFVASRISQLLSGKEFVRQGDSLRPIRPEDIVILLRSPKSVGGEFAFALAQQGIRCVMEGDIDLLQTDEVNALVVILQTIHNPLQDIPLIAALSGKAFGFTADELASIRTSSRSGSFYEALQKANTAKTQAFLEKLKQLREASRLMSLSQLVDRILTQTHLDSCYASMEDGQIRTANIQAFCQIVSEFESAGNRDLLQLLQFLEAMSEKGLYVSGSQGSGAVTITSIHKSKGLEYPVVFLCGLSKRFNQEDVIKSVLCDGELGLGLFCIDQKDRLRYPSVSKRAIAEKMIRQSVSEELRVLYVAMTRARDRLIMTYAHNRLEGVLSDMANRMDLSGDVLMSSEATGAGSWILQTALRKTEAGELFALGGRPEHTQLSSHPWLIRVVRSNGISASLEETEEETQSVLDSAVADRIKCSLEFQYPYLEATVTPSKQTATQLKGREKDREINEYAASVRTYERSWRSPSFVEAKVSAKEYGTAYHKVMQYLDFDACNSKEGVAAEMKRLERETLISAEQAAMIDAEKIKKFFESELGDKLRKGGRLLREFKFSILVDAPTTSGEKVLLQGVVDCALIEPDGITVVDFKTDRVNDKTVDAVAQGYASQVMAYANALEKIYQMPVKAGYLYFFQTADCIDITKMVTQ